MSERTQHNCNDCGHCFNSIRGLDRHQQLQECKKIYFCDICNEGFSKMYKLNAHARIRCRPAHLCYVCGKKFADINGLNEHVAICHADLKPYVCNICSEGYATLRDLSKHIRTHKSKTCFRCNRCGKRFTSHSRLKSHAKVVHVDTLLFVCKICNEAFAQEDFLNDHIGIHMDDKEPLSTVSGEDELAGSDEESGRKISVSDEKEQGECCSKTEDTYVKEEEYVQEEKDIKEEIDIKEESF